MIFITIILMFLYFILPVWIYLKIIEKLDYKLGKYNLEPKYAFIIFIIEIAFFAQIIYWIN